MVAPIPRDVDQFDPEAPKLALFDQFEAFKESLLEIIDEFPEDNMLSKETSELEELFQLPEDQLSSKLSQD